MAKSRGGFRAALLAGWATLCVAGVLFARAKGIPVRAALSVIAAFLVEYPFYLVAGFPLVRERLSSSALPAILAGVMVLPYLVCCTGAVTFQWDSLLRLAALALALALWYRVLHVSVWADLGFLAMIGWVMLGRYFDPVYPELFRQRLSILGHLSLFQISTLVLMLERRVPETGFGFLPTTHEWRTGLLHYLYFLPTGGALAVATGAVHLGRSAPVGVVVLTFFGFLWVVGLWEEFLFRGVLQQWFEAWTANPLIALFLTAAVFGSVHLWFRGFPNWRWALVTFILGALCGRARNLTGGIRAGTVLHALVVATWRAFF
jgi:hypothetical protein